MISAPLRTIKSFVLRQGRMTHAQSLALKNYLASYALSCDTGFYEWEAVFKRKAPTYLEIGFGMGDFLIQQTSLHPDINFIGVEVHAPGVGKLLDGAAEKDIQNLKIFNQDVIQVLEKAIPDESLDRIWILFPDPWPKTRHHKRRLIQLEFIQLITAKLKKGAQLHLATDWEDYAHHMLQVLDNSALNNTCGTGHFAPLEIEEGTTKFQRRAKKLGHSVWELRYQK